MYRDIDSFIPAEVTGEERKQIKQMITDRLGQIALESALVMSTEQQKQELLEKLRTAGGGEAGLEAIAEFAALVPNLAEGMEQAIDMELASLRKVMGWAA